MNMSAKKRKRCITGIFLLIVAIGAAAGSFYMLNGKDTDEQTENVFGEYDGMRMGNGNITISLEGMGSVISGSGTSYYENSSQDFNMSFKDNDGDSVYLQVEEVYVSQGDEVTEGTPIYKLTDKSVEKIKEILESAYNSAKEKYENANYTYNKGVLNAKCTLMRSLGISETALASYELEIENLNKKVEAAMAQVNEADSILAEYPGILQEIFNDEDAYIELKEDCQEKLDSLRLLLVSAKAKQEEAEKMYDEAEINYKYLSGNSSGETAAGTATSGNAELSAELERAEQEYAAAKKVYEAAKTETDLINSQIKQYESQIKQLEEKLNDLKSDADKYYDEYVEADENSEDYNDEYEELIQKLSSEITKAENSYEESVFTYTNAQHYYELQVEDLKNDLEESIEDYEKTQKALEEFESVCGDGIIRADRDGRLVSVPYFEGRPLTAGALATYYDYDKLSVQVSIGQSDIKNISVGDLVNVYADSAMTVGEVTSIKTTAVSQGASRVYFTVTVSIPVESGITSGLAVSVYFNMNGEKNEKNY